MRACATRGVLPRSLRFLYAVQATYERDVQTVLARALRAGIPDASVVYKDAQREDAQDERLFLYALSREVQKPDALRIQDCVLLCGELTVTFKTTYMPTVFHACFSRECVEKERALIDRMMDKWKANKR